MKTALIVILASVGAGLALAYSEVSSNNANLKNLLGGVSDLEATVAGIKAPNSERVSSVEVVGGESLEFGTMRRGTVKHHKFVVKNTGKTDVEVWFKASSCKCTVGKFERATLKPDESTDVELEWKAEGFGEFAQTATLGTSIPGKEELKLTIKGQITEAVAFDPPTLELGDFLSNSPHEFSGRIINYGEQLIQLDNISVADAKFESKFHITFDPPREPTESELTGLDKPKQVVDFKVVIDKGLPSGRVGTQLIFHSAQPSEGQDILATTNFPAYHVNGRCLNPIRVIAGSRYDEDRDILDLGIVKAADGIKLSFVFGIRTDDFPDANITLRKITPEAVNSLLKVTVGEANVNKNQKLFPVTIEVPAGAAPAEYNGASGKDYVKLTFDTNMTDSPEESIYLKFVTQQ